MKIELLRTFLEVSRTLHFRHASEALCITQSAVSARIKLLEDDLGVLLFDRRQKHLKLTPEGHRLIKHANELIFMWQKTKLDVAGADTDSVQLAIGAMMSIWDIILQDWIQDVHQHFGDIGLITNTYSSLELRKHILNRIVDVAFLFEPPFVEELVVEKVATVPLHLITTDPNHDSGTVPLKNYVMVDYGESINAQHMREFGDSAPGRHFMSQPRIALDFILKAGGSAYLPRQMTAEYIKSNKLYSVDSAPIYSREIYAAYLNKNTKLDLIRETIKLFSI